MPIRSRSILPVSAPGSACLVAPDFHPEFGLLCPSPRRRRRLRLAVTMILAGIGIAATVELAIAHWHDADAAAQILIAGSIEEAAAIPQPSGIRVAPMQPSESAGLAEAWPLQHGSCKDAASRDLAASFLNSDCRSRKVRARHAERTGSRVATFMVGRAESPPASAEVGAMPYGATARAKQ
jgi:hypothetical protein